MSFNFTDFPEVVAENARELDNIKKSLKQFIDNSGGRLEENVA
jgi:hypothetical protein